MNNVEKVIGNRMLVNRISTAVKSEIYMPQETIQKMFLGVVRKVGDEVKDRQTIVEDRICLFNSFSAQKAKKANEWFFNEQDVILVKVGGNYHPFGYRILVSRLNNTEVSRGGVIIPTGYKSSDQTLFGVVYSKGISNNNIIDIPIDVGDIIKIQKWDTSIKEVEFDGLHYLSVPLSLVEYKCDKETFDNNFVK